MSITGSDGAKNVFFSLENIVRKEYPSHENYTYVGIYTEVLLGVVKIIFARILFILARSSTYYEIKIRNT
jgi:hypothetical protein